jgi:CRP/FNR family cyclic AMP-dependent transcriptional regulator
MNELEVVEILYRLRFLEGFEIAGVQQIASIARLEEYPADTLLFREGEKFTRIFLVVEGSVALEMHIPDKGTRRIQAVGPGDLVGWSPVLGSSPMTASARTLAPTRVVAVGASQMMVLCYHDPRFGFAFMRQTAKALADRLNATRLHLLEVYGHQLPLVPSSHEGAG